MEGQTRARGGPPPWAIVAALGAVVAGVGVFLPWAEGATGGFVEQDGEFTLNIGLLDRATAGGISHWIGIAALVGAVVSLVGATWALSRSTSRAASFLTVLGGVVVLAAAVYGFFQASDIAAGKGGGTEVVLFGERSYGLYVTGVGGLLATLGGLMVFLRARRTTATV
jgi:hypothetical protein